MNSIKIILLSISSIIGLSSGSLFSAQAKLQAPVPTKPTVTITNLDYSPKKAFNALIGTKNAATEVQACAATLCIQSLIPVGMTEEQLKAKFKDAAFRCQLLEHLKAHIDTISSSLGFFDVNKTVTQGSVHYNVGVQVTAATARVDHWLNVLETIRKDIHEFSIDDKGKLRELAKTTPYGQATSPFKLNEEELLEQALGRVYAQEQEEAKINDICLKTKAINRKVRGAMLVNAASNWFASKINASLPYKQ